MPRIYLSAFINKVWETNQKFLLFDSKKFKNPPSGFNTVIEFLDFILDNLVEFEVISYSELVEQYSKIEQKKDNFYAIPLYKKSAENVDIKEISLEELLFSSILIFDYGCFLNQKSVDTPWVYFLLRRFGTKIFYGELENISAIMKSRDQLYLHHILFNKDKRLSDEFCRWIAKEEVINSAATFIEETYRTKKNKDLKFHMWVTNGPSQGNEQLNKFFKKVIKINPCLILNAGSNQSYSTHEKTYTADFLNYFIPNQQGKVFFGEKYRPSRLIKTTGKLCLYGVGIDQHKELLVLHSATPDTGFDGDVEFYNEAELRFVLQVAAFVVAGLDPSKQHLDKIFLAHCHAGLNRSPAWLAIYYFACLVAMGFFDKQKFESEKALDEMLEKTLKEMRDNFVKLHKQESWSFVDKENWEDQVKNTWKRLLKLKSSKTELDINSQDAFTKKFENILKILQTKIDRIIKEHGALIRHFDRSPRIFDTLQKLKKAEIIQLPLQTKMLTRYMYLKNLKQIMLYEADNEMDLSLLIDCVLNTPEMEFLQGEFSQFKSDANSVRALIQRQTPNNRVSQPSPDITELIKMGNVKK